MTGGNKKEFDISPAPFIHSFIHSFKKYVLSIGHRPGILAGQQGYNSEKGTDRTQSSKGADNERVIMLRYS